MRWPPRLRAFGDAVQFSVTATGTAPLTYQRFFTGIALTDGARVSGSAAATVALANLQGSDAGNYTVVVSNGFGTVTSQVAVLTLGAPAGSSTAVGSLPAQCTPGTALTVMITVF